VRYRRAVTGSVVTAKSWWSALLPAALVAAGVTESTLSGKHSVLAAAALYVPGAVAVAVRRRWPLAAAGALAAVTLASGLGGGVRGGFTLWVAWAVAFYGLGLRTSADRRRWATALVVLVSVAFLPSANGRLENFLAACGVSILIPYLAGLLRHRHLHAQRLQAEAERLERQREAAVRRAAQEERARLARELHDIVSHTVGTIAVQAEAGDALIDRDPASARASVQAIQHSARAAMVELRRLLALLRADDPQALRSPQPGLGELPGLVARMASAGLRVAIAVSGAPRPLPPAIDLSAYRVLQEALTNVLVHSGADEASVQVGFTTDRLELEVCDPGRGTPAPFGSGLTGMRERVLLLGGELEAGPVLPGWRVRVWLPLPHEDGA
jgi:signal transduction histidine kinase